MVRSITYVMIAFVSYFLILYIFNSLFSFLLLREEFVDIEEYYIDLIETVIYSFLILFSLLFIKKRKYSLVRRFSGSSTVFLMLLLTVLYRLLEDPILRFSVIDGLEAVPALSKAEYTSSVSQFIIFFNLIILAAIFEELLFRKIMLSFFKSNNVNFGIVFCSFLFALIHLKGWHFNLPILISSFSFSVLASIIYLKYDIIHSVVFHSSYNILWCILLMKKQEYWDVLVFLNFGYYYWLTILGSLIGFMFLSYYLFVKMPSEDIEKRVVKN